MQNQSDESGWKIGPFDWYIPIAIDGWGLWIDDSIL